jgi:uncharacterized protein YcgL (UPF0745 family)
MKTELENKIEEYIIEQGTTLQMPNSECIIMLYWLGFLPLAKADITKYIERIGFKPELIFELLLEKGYYFNTVNGVEQLFNEFNLYIPRVVKS